ncbi:hypothetical protein [Paraburkholderia heleia]|uniref:hypothetical protein n=1 Tax=Paraburkholderia heleia TaxID=634127 RepID=UPI0031D7CB75
MPFHIHRIALYEGYETDVAVREINSDDFVISCQRARKRNGGTWAFVIVKNAGSYFPSVEAAFHAGNAAVRARIDEWRA